MDDIGKFSNLLNNSQAIEASCAICNAARTLKSAHSTAKKLTGIYDDNFNNSTKFGKNSTLITDLKYITKLK